MEIMNRIRRYFPGRVKYMNNITSSLYDDSFLDYLQQRRALAEQLVKDRVAKDLNKGIDDAVSREVENGALSHVKMTREARDRAQGYISNFRDILDGAGIENQELGFYLISGDQPVITDIHLNKQWVNPIHCDIVVNEQMSERYRRRTGKRIASWAHSHGSLSVFLSGTDISTLKNIVPQYYEGFKLDIEVPWGDDNLKYQVHYFPTVVMNNAGDIYAAVQVKYPKVTRQGDSYMPSRHSMRLASGVPIRWVQGERPEPYDDKSIREDLMAKVRVPYRRGYTLLSNLMPSQESGLEERVRNNSKQSLYVQ
ncbi:MAG: hypothetical protein KJ709_08415 [Nanoarchaeota archaeon]|nr:hypothetical protein [Nanoarchaeota archaeon]